MVELIGHVVLLLSWDLLGFALWHTTVLKFSGFLHKTDARDMDVSKKRARDRVREIELPLFYY